MAGVSDSSGPQALFACVAIGVKRICKFVQVYDLSGHHVVLPRHRTCCFCQWKTHWPENKTSLLEHTIKKSSQLYKCKHHIWHNQSGSAATLEKKKKRPSWTKPLQEMLRKWLTRGGWPSGKWCHPLCSLFITREKGGFGLLNTHGNEMWGKPRIY